MTHSEFTQILNSLNGLTAEQMQHLQRELESRMAEASHRPDADPLLGSMADHTELMDQIVEEAMQNREHQPWRLAPGE